MRTRRLAAPLLAGPLFALSLLGAACGRLSGPGSPPSDGGIAHPTGPNDLVVRWEYRGGFVSPESLLGRIPSFSLYGDGRIITEGPQIDIYPGPALPNLIVQAVNEDGIQAILSAARDAGLLNGDASYPYPCVADAPDTTFTVVADGRTSIVSATALGGGDGACEGGDVRSRAELFAFWTKLGNLAGWLPNGSIGQEQQYRPDAIRIYVRPYVAEDPSLTQSPIRWPGSPLSLVGGQVDPLPEVRCGVVTGAEASDVLRAAESANRLTPWVSGGRDFGVVFRPLLPDESGC
jgi:hypothetical protein